MDQSTENLLRELSKKLGTTTEKLYSVLVKQSKLNAISDIIYLVFWVFGLVALFYINGLTTYTYVKDYLTNWPVSNYAYITVWLLNIIGWVASLFYFPSAITSIITNLKNPEYNAVQTILDSIRPE